MLPEKFTHILRIQNTNIDGKRQVMYALTAIKVSESRRQLTCSYFLQKVLRLLIKNPVKQGMGRRFSNLVCKKANVDPNKRAGELSDEEVEKITTVMANPRQYKIPDWFLNRQKDIRDGKHSQVISNNLDNKLREDLERLKKIRAHRGLRHYWGLRVRGQHTKTTGRRGRTVGVAKKK